MGVETIFAKIGDNLSVGFKSRVGYKKKNSLLK